MVDGYLCFCLVAQTWMFPAKLLVEGRDRSLESYGGMVIDSSNMIVDCLVG